MEAGIDETGSRHYPINVNMPRMQPYRPSKPDKTKTQNLKSGTGQGTQPHKNKKNYNSSSPRSARSGEDRPRSQGSGDLKSKALKYHGNSTGKTHFGTNKTFGTNQGQQKYGKVNFNSNKYNRRRPMHLDQQVLNLIPGTNRYSSQVNSNN